MPAVIPARSLPKSMYLHTSTGVEDEDWTADEEDLGTRNVRDAMMYEAATRSRVELSLGHASIKTYIDGGLAMWPTPNMHTLTSLSSLHAGTSTPDSFLPPSSPTGCHPTFGLHHYSIDKNVTHGTISPHAYTPPHGKASGAETTSTTAWSSC